MHTIYPATAQQFPLVETRVLDPAPIEEIGHPFGGAGEDQLRQRIGELTKALLRFTQCRLGLLAKRDVFSDADDAYGTTGVVANAFAVIEDPARSAVRAHDAKFELKGFIPGVVEPVIVALRDQGPVVWVDAFEPQAVPLV